MIKGLANSKLWQEIAIHPGLSFTLISLTELKGGGVAGFEKCQVCGEWKIPENNRSFVNMERGGWHTACTDCVRIHGHY